MKNSLLMYWTIDSKANSLKYFSICSSFIKEYTLLSHAFTWWTIVLTAKKSTELLLICSIEYFCFKGLYLSIYRSLHRHLYWYDFQKFWLIHRKNSLIWSTSKTSVKEWWCFKLYKISSKYTKSCAIFMSLTTTDKNEEYIDTNYMTFKINTEISARFLSSCIVTKGWWIYHNFKGILSQRE